MRRAAAAAFAADPAYPRVKALVIEKTGMVFFAERDEDLIRALRQRLAALHLPDCSAYLDHLWTEPGRSEFDELIADLTIGETYFFRYREQYEALRDVALPDIIERNRSERRLRVWSAGCATGPEAYTLAIILRQRFGSEIDGWNVEILGSDINQRFLAAAREAEFDDWALRATPEHVKQACFARVGKRWRLAPEYREGISFTRHNLIDDPYPGGFDLIMCRNVVIYFSTETFQAIIRRFSEALAPGGWLVVGHSEMNDDLFRAFHAHESPGAILYRKPRAGEPSPARPPAAIAPAPLAAPAPAPAPPPPSWGLPRIEAPPSVPSPSPAPAATASRGDLDDLRRLADRAEWPEAVRRCRNMIEADPLDAVVYLYYGLVLDQMGEGDKAEHALRRAIYLDRGFVLPHYHLGLLLQQRGDRAGAARAFRNAIKLLSGLPRQSCLPQGDGITAGELEGLARLHLGVVGS